MLTLVSYPTRPARFTNRRTPVSFTYPATAEPARLPVDVVEQDGEFVLTAAVPGLQPEALHLEVIGDTVTVRGEMAAEPDAQDGWLLRERPVGGKFARTLRFPAELDSTKIEASLENGLLTVHLPKAETAKPKLIRVKAN